MKHVLRTLVAIAVAASFVGSVPRAIQAQRGPEPSARAASLDHSRPPALHAAVSDRGRPDVSPPATARDTIDAVRRQPKFLLEGMVLTRAEKKAVSGIVRRNAKTLRTFEERERSAATGHRPDWRLAVDIIDLRELEREELREALNPPHRVVFDKNLARLRSMGR